jgi:hypothetical protein
MRKNSAKIALAITTMSIMLTALACSKIANLLTFNLSMQTESFNITIPVTTDTGSMSVSATTSYNVDSFIKASTAGQLGASNIKSVKLSSVVLTLNNANAGNNFQNFSAVDLAFSSNANSNPYTISVASNPDNYSSALSIPIDSTVDLSTYLGNEFSYSVSGKLRKATTQELNCAVTVTFSLTVKG